MRTVQWTPEFSEIFTYYDKEDMEQLNFDSLDEYMDDHVSNDVSEDIGELLEDNTEFEVFGYRCMSPARDECKFLDRLIERIDEERGDPEGCANCFSGEQERELEAVVKIVVPFRIWFESQDAEYQKTMLENTAFENDRRSEGEG